MKVKCFYSHYQITVIYKINGMVTNTVIVWNYLNSKNDGNELI